MYYFIFGDKKKQIIAPFPAENRYREPQKRYEFQSAMKHEGWDEAVYKRKRLFQTYCYPCVSVCEREFPSCSWGEGSYFFNTSYRENEACKCFKLEISNRSMNIWSEILVLAAAKRWYSSKIEARHHCCIFLRHPTRQPVRCYKQRDPKLRELINFLSSENDTKELEVDTFPRLQWIRTGWFLTSVILS